MSMYSEINGSKQNKCYQMNKGYADLIIEISTSVVIVIIVMNF